MGSRGQMPPPPLHMKRPFPGLGMDHPDTISPGIRPPPSAFPPNDMPCHPEVLEQMLSAQHIQMQKLLTDNQTLAGSVRTLRQELAAAQHKVQTLQAEIGAVETEREQQTRAPVNKIARMEADLQAAETVKYELQKGRDNTQSLVEEKQELISKAQKLTQDIQRAHAEAHILPALMSELEGLRHEYHHVSLCRATYDYQKKLCNGHLESVQVMEKNNVEMARKVEKLQAELNNTAAAEKRTGRPYGGMGYNEKEVSWQDPVGQKTTEDNHGVPQKPSRSACRKKARRQWQREIRETVKELFPLSKVQVDAQDIVVTKQERISKSLTQNIQSSHPEVHILPTLMSELEGLRHDHKHARATYNCVEKLYNGHLESTQAMEKYYVNIARQVEKFEGEVNNIVSSEKQTDGPYGGTGDNEKEVSRQDPVGQKTTKDNHGVPQKPSRSARRKKAKRQWRREILKAKEEVFPEAQKTTENDHGVAQKVGRSTRRAYAKRQWLREIKKAFLLSNNTCSQGTGELSAAPKL